MGPHVITSLEVICMPYQAKDFEPPVVQSEKSPYANIIDTCLLRPVERGNAPFIIRFSASQVIPFICFRMICFLEYLVRSYACCTYFPESFNIERCSIDIDSPYLPVAFPD